MPAEKVMPIPCPFCGVALAWCDEGDGFWEHPAGDCIIVFKVVEPGAVKKWNRRAKAMETVAQASNIPQGEICPACNGTGAPSADVVGFFGTCYKCEGKGKLSPVA